MLVIFSGIFNHFWSIYSHHYNRTMKGDPFEVEILSISTLFNTHPLQSIYDLICSY